MPSRLILVLLALLLTTACSSSEPEDSAGTAGTTGETSDTSSDNNSEGESSTDDTTPGESDPSDDNAPDPSDTTTPDPLSPSTQFAPTATKWRVPDNGEEDGFFWLGWSQDNTWFSSLDINGDGLLDIIQTADPAQSGGQVERDAEGALWRVYLNSGSGFSGSSIRWSVPEPTFEDGFFATAYNSYERWFTTLDINGDGRPDLIQTADSERSGGFVWTDDQGPYWKVFLNQGNGFSLSETRWAVPQSGTDDGFFATAWMQDNRWFTLLDINGDGLADLIHTGDTERQNGFAWDDEDGQFWKVYLNQGDGFATTATRWPLPSSGQSDGFFTTNWANETRWFTTFDITGDGRPDLIHTGDTERQNGFVWRDDQGPYWKVYRNDGSGFSQSATRLSIPESGLDDGFFTPSWSQQERSFATFDLNGDGRVELIHTADPNQSGGYIWQDEQGPFWKVYPLGDDGFSDIYERWAVPQSGLDDGFFTTAWAYGERWFVTLDISGDGRADLVQTAEPDRSGGFVFSDEQGPYWQVWLGQE